VKKKQGKEAFIFQYWVLNSGLHVGRHTGQEVVKGFLPLSGTK
jgi:hypothetical protein